jgi:hypothetical protein
MLSLVGVHKTLFIFPCKNTEFTYHDHLLCIDPNHHTLLKCRDKLLILTLQIIYSNRAQQASLRLSPGPIG